MLFDLCEKEKQNEIMKWVLKPENLDGVQPYFMHYVFEAVNKVGIFEKYGMELLRKWQVLVEMCEKGLREVWTDYEGYEIDYSHGWGATPTYQLPNKILGLEILKPGFKKIRINPNLYDLEWAKISVPTPFGEIKCDITKTGTDVDIPDGIEVVE